MTAIGDFFRKVAATHRESAKERPDDPRYPRSADSLDDLADYADQAADEGLFQMRYLLDHHVVDGEFAWPDGQSGRTVARFGFDQPVQDPMEREMFLMDLCDLAKIDASRHVGTPESGFERADAPEIAKRYGLGIEIVHRALDSGRGYVAMFAVAIPHWHAVSDSARAKLEELDGVALRPAREEDFPDEDEPPLVAINVVADSETHARETVAEIVGIEPDALGIKQTARIL
jgi:hypothetical protein